MSDAERSWWLDADRTWRRGTPPDGWQQGSDGRWYAPYHGPEHTTEELAVLPTPPTQLMAADQARHLAAAGRRAGPDQSEGRARRAGATSLPPPWAKAAIAALVAVVLLSTAGVLAVASRSRDGAPARASDELGAFREGVAETGQPTSTTPPTTPAPDEAGSASDQADDAGSPTTTAPAPTSTTTPPPDEPGSGDPLAACSAGQRNVIERGNHPWEWYLARFDENGDGILCT